MQQRHRPVEIALYDGVAGGREMHRAEAFRRVIAFGVVVLREGRPSAEEQRQAGRK
jgi:hypothetical protein